MEQITVDPNTQLTLVVNVEQYNVIMAGLGELPLKFSGPVVGALSAQAEEQLRPKPEPIAPAPVEPAAVA